jgi:hypothetical protein
MPYRVTPPAHCMERSQGTRADKLTPTTLPEYLMWYEALQREIAWFLCQTMLARLQQGATRDEVLRWLLGRPFALTIPPSITHRAREYFHSAYEEASRQRQNVSGTPRHPRPTGITSPWRY